MRRVRLITVCIMIAVILTAAFHTGSVFAMEDVTISTLGFKPDFNYAVNPQVPKLIVDNEGYIPAGKKVVFLYGNDYDKSFSIVDMKTDETVYTGSFIKLDIAEDDSNHIYIGDFSALMDEGTYRAYQNDVGYSYEFVIDAGIYKNEYRHIYDDLSKRVYTSKEDLIYVLAGMLTTHEIYPDAYIDDAFIEKSIRSLMSGKDLITSLTTRAQLAGVLAQYFCDYLDINKELTDEALKLAISVYAEVDKYSDNLDPDSYYYCAAEVYRATGAFSCRNAIAKYDREDMQDKSYSDYDYKMMGDIAYLSSRNRTDYSRCEAIMNGYQDEMVELSGKTDRIHHYVQNDIDISNTTELLNNMMKLGIVSYVISGREYASIEANYIHYLSGANPDNIDYFNVDSTNFFLDSGDIVGRTKLLFILAGN